MEARCPFAPGRILVVDDLETNRDALRRLLEREGHAVETAADGEEALDKARAGGFDLLLLDVMMPRMDGFEALSILKADPELSGLPVILLSALQEARSLRDGLERGAEDYLFKPLDRSLLRTRVAACLRRKRLQDEAREASLRLEAQEAELQRLRRLEVLLREALDALPLPADASPEQLQARTRLEQAVKG